MNIANRISIHSEKNYIRIGIRKKTFAQLGSNIRFGGSICLNRTENMNIGDDVFFGDGCYFEAVSSISIGSGCMFGPRVFCIAGSHNYDSPDLKSLPYDDRQVDMPVVIENNVWIAGNVSIAPGTHIGKGVVVGMGTTVAGSIPDYSVVVGQKGTVIKRRDAKIYNELAAHDKIFNKLFIGTPFSLVTKNNLR